MTTFYISGPTDGYPQRNYPAFHKVGEDLKKSGVEILSLAHDKSGNPIQPPYPDEERLWENHVDLWQEQLRESLNNILLCDGVHMLNDWGASPVAGLEHRIAMLLGITITYQGEE